MSDEESSPNGRDRALLRAIARGRCQLSSGCEPVLLVDGLTCADSTAARRLITTGLVRAPDPTRVLGPAVLTPAGRAALVPARLTSH
jgi:hypothetical protein